MNVLAAYAILPEGRNGVKSPAYVAASAHGTRHVHDYLKSMCALGKHNKLGQHQIGTHKPHIWAVATREAITIL